MATVLLCFRVPISERLSRLTEASGFGGSLKFSEALAQAEDLAISTEAKEPAKALPAPTTSPLSNDPREPPPLGADSMPYSGLSASVAVTWAFRHVLTGLGRAAESIGQPVEVASVDGMRKAARSLGMSGSEIEQLDRLRELRDQAAHGRNGITDDEAQRFVLLAKGLSRKIESRAELARADGPAA